MKRSSRNLTWAMSTLLLLAVLTVLSPGSYFTQEVNEETVVLLGERTLRHPDLWQVIEGTTQPTSVIVFPADVGYPSFHMTAVLVEFPQGMGYTLQVYDCADSTFTTVLAAEATTELSLIGTAYTPNPLWKRIGPRTNGLLILRAVCKLTPLQEGPKA